jgi:phage/plasmid-like protein (TIGR03299 family)
MTANIQTMMYVGDEPWHKQGKRLEKVATSEEAIIGAGLNWLVVKQPLVLKDYPQIEVPRFFANQRQDDKTILGVVGSNYTVLQNKDAFRFCDALVGEAAAMYHTAGALGKGEVIWILAKLPKTIHLKNEDDVENYLLFSHRHDGKQRIRVMFTPIRVVCQNTLSQAVHGAKNQALISHTKSMGSRLIDVRDQLGIIYKRLDVFEELSNKMADKQIKVSEFKDYLGKLDLATEAVEIGTKAEEQKQSRKAEVEELLTSLFEFGPGAMLKSARGTLWGAYNSVTRYVDYEKSANCWSESSRANSILFGNGALIKQRALQEAVNLL